jgi:hypothetical protein
MGVSVHFVVRRVAAVKVDGRTLRYEGYMISIINDDAHLTVWVRLVGVVKQLKAIMTDLVGINEAVIEVIAEEQYFMHNQYEPLACMFIAPRRGYGGNGNFVHCTKLVMESADRAFLAGIVY